jgi:uncharacterized membrane protein YdbT with pleckstrin-like domain
MDKVTRLKNVRLFSSLTPDNLARVAELAARSSHRRGSYLCRQDEYGDTLYIIDSGEAIRRQTDLRGVQRPVGYMREGESIGEDALLLGDAYGSCVQATSDIKVLYIRKQDFDRLVSEHPQIEQQLTIPPLIRERLLAPSLPWQDEDEPTLLLRRKHWFAFARTLPAPVLILLVLGTFAWLLRRVGILTTIPSTLLFVSVIPAMLLLWLVLDWRNDYYLVTSKRVLHEERVLLLYQTWDEVPLSKIQSINITRGFTGSMLGFGTLQIQTASARGTLALPYVPDPEGMQEVIFKKVGQLRWRMQQGQRDEIRQELLRQSGAEEAEEEHAIPAMVPEEQARTKLGPLARFVSRRPLLRMRYNHANQIIWRKHWLFLLKRIYLALPFAILVSVAFITVSLYGGLARYRLPLLPAALVLWIAGIFWLWWQVEDWRNDVYIVTDRLIIDIEKKPLFFAEDRKQATLDVIQNVSLSKRGILTSLLNYGDVLIQIAGASGTFTFEGVPQPEAVQREIFRRVEDYNESQRRQQGERRKAELSTWFEVYQEINKERESPGKA